MTASTGSVVLDRALDGGFPTEQAVLVTGGPGTGKTTLAMQFLHEGLQTGDRCLFVSTEQTADDLATAFDDFVFDLGHDDLTVTSIHASMGHTLEDEDERLTIETFEDGPVFEDYSAPFEPRYIVEQLRQFGPVDRVVLDSVSGLSAMGESRDRYRRAVFDLMELFTAEFGATALLTAEETGSADPGSGDDRRIAAADAIQFNTHGVVRLWRERVGGGSHRFVEIVKMRGVDHDTRVFELDFTPEGVRTYPRNRTAPVDFAPDDHLPTGIEGLDDLLGGGVTRGGTVLLEHDGRANPHWLLTAIVERAVVEEDFACMFVPPVELPPKRLRSVIDARVGDVDELLADDRLFLVDFPNIWENTRRNVFKPTEDGATPESIFRTVDERRGDRPLLSVVNVEAQIPVLDDDELRQMRFWGEENFYGAADTSVYFFNPATLSDRLAAFYENSAWQVVETWIADHGLQYLTLKKAPSGYLGSTRLVEYTDEAPHIHVQRPPGAGETGGHR
jgi:KaiC/GvpD/RAD55 family RecA-like ATPase